ncbi:MAG: glycosyltransferase [Acidobacteria bacterium]|nr:glycosyltransferase [Acidobacteriota bacterium]
MSEATEAAEAAATGGRAAPTATRAVRLCDLPAPPAGREGWPWTVETPPPPASPRGGGEWLRVSVVTPSYNQGRFLEQTVRSVLLQGYPNLEYIVVDGGSTDESVRVIKKYEKFLAHWESGRDRGQSHAINKGFARSTGEIMCWLNSDDYFLPGALRAVAEALADGAGADAVVGHCVQVYADGRAPVEGKGEFESLTRLLEFWKGYRMHQPSIFWRRKVFERVGYLDESLHLTMDFDYWARAARHFPFANVDRALSCATYHDDAKTGDGFARYRRELRRTAARYFPPAYTPAHWRLRASMIKHLDLLPLAARLRNSFAYRAGRARRLLAGGSR